MSKKILIFMLALILSLGLVGCGDNTSEMVLVEAGTTSEENGGVTVENDFYIGKYHVTQAEFEEVMGFNPSVFTKERHPNLIGDTANRPVENVTWYDALMYANKLSEREGLDKYYNISNIEYDDDNIDSATVTEDEEANGYRLPTENEHEYAARGGKDGEATIYAGSDILDEVGWYEDNSYEANSEWDGSGGVAGRGTYEGSGTMPVGEKEANELGLYDMSGNLFDWTGTIDSDSLDIICGGSWDYHSRSCKVDYHDLSYRNLGDYGVGFRLTKTK